MKINKAKAVIYLDSTHPKANQQCAIYIRVTFNRVRKYYPTSESLTIEDFEKALTEKPGKKLEEIANKIKADKTDANKIINDLPNFTFDLFEKKFITNRNLKDTIESAFDAAIKKLTENDQIGTAVSYGCAKKSFELFKPGLKFTDITIPFLNSYEKQMLDSNKTTTTISIYVRHLRTIYNIAIEDTIIPKEASPFGAKRYQPPESNNTKKAITLDEVVKVYNYPTKKNSTAERAKAYWLFSYFCNGINIKDMALLKTENIKGNMICFQRAKTVRTKRKIEDIEVEITDRMQDTIKKFGNRPSKDNYLFPILTHGLTATRQRQLIQQITAVINSHMKDIGKDLKIETPLTSYVARHTMATVAKNKGISIEKISEALGHSNIKTTGNYLAKFDKESKIELANILNSF